MQSIWLASLPYKCEEQKEQNIWISVAEEENGARCCREVGRCQILQRFVGHVKDLVLLPQIKSSHPLKGIK